MQGTSNSVHLPNNGRMDTLQTVQQEKATYFYRSPSAWEEEENAYLKVAVPIIS